MAKYVFWKWVDEGGVTLGSSPSLTYTPVADKTIQVTWVLVRTLIYKSTPVSVPGTANGAAISPNQSIEVVDGQSVTFVVPPTVTA